MSALDHIHLVEPVAATYGRLAARRASVLALGGVALALAALLDVATGPAFLNVGAVARSVIGYEIGRASCRERVS
jgi:iron complex transport system permease protein